MKVKPKLIFLCYHGKVEDSAHWTQRIGLSDQLLRPVQCADVIGRHQHLHILVLPLKHALRLVP